MASQPGFVKGGYLKLTFCHFSSFFLHYVFTRPSPAPRSGLQWEGMNWNHRALGASFFLFCITIMLSSQIFAILASVLGLQITKCKLFAGKYFRPQLVLTQKQKENGGRGGLRGG